ncbi:MAG: hypothetical protein HW412_1591, partial [Bacteroidetes bacterium]|nr:hypothetical protein [Bacteroidota bacterium]
RLHEKQQSSCKGSLNPSIKENSMAKTKLEIIADLKGYISNNGGNFREWYVGVSDDATNKLIARHNVNQQLDKWFFRTSPSPAIAKEVEYYFVKILSAQGSPEGSTETGNMVYAYKKSARTNP